MTDHELEQRLQRIDPVPAATSVDTPDSPQARAIMEQIMQTQATPVEEPTSSRRRWVAAAAAVVGAAAAIAIGVAIVRNDSTSSEPVAATYELQASDPMAMCLALTDAPPPPSGAVAFGGTVTEVTADSVVVDVDRTFAGDEVDVATLAAGPDVTDVALDGVEFVPGQRYLVTVVDGRVQTCGVSGPASPELEAIYAGWFGLSWWPDPIRRRGSRLGRPRCGPAPS